jgi:hypothetical protein
MPTGAAPKDGNAPRRLAKLATARAIPAQIRWPTIPGSRRVRVGVVGGEMIRQMQCPC